MGIYLPNMEMPENCICCDLSHEDGWCPAKQTYADRYTFKTCPLVPVPPHGRLGDLDELHNHLNEWYLTHEHGFSETEKIYIRAMLSGVKDSPTIIPAEEGEA